jgi:hypothetical protein
MTLTLELAPEVERVLENEAQSARRSVAEVAAAWLAEAARARQAQRAVAVGANGQTDSATGDNVPDDAGNNLTPRQRAVLEGYGKFAGRVGSVEDFLAERHAEAERELEAMAQRTKSDLMGEPTTPQNSEVTA